MGTGFAPQIVVLEKNVNPQATAGSDLTTVLGKAPFDGVITAVEYITPTAITGADTNSRHVEVQNRTAGGTPKPASLAFTSGINTVAFTGKALTLSGTAANLNVAKGDVLSFNSVHDGTGIADPGGVVRVTIQRNQ